MTKNKIELALNCPVELTDFEDEIHQGWLVKSKLIKNCYLILPFNSFGFERMSFKPSHIKSIKHLINGVVIK